MEKQYKNTNISEFLDDLASRLPAPGGGAAAALTAAQAACLVSMVVQFTLGKTKYEKYKNNLEKTLVISEKLRKDFMNFVDLDCAAYKSGNLRDALDVPFMVCRLSFEGIKLCPGLVRYGNRNLISDAAIAAVLFEAAFTSAFYNVKVNLESLADAKLSAGMLKELKSKLVMVRSVRAKTEASIGKLIRG